MFIIQARPETVQSVHSKNVIERDSLSLNPDSVVPTTAAIYKKEQHLRKKRGFLSLFF